MAVLISAIFFSLITIALCAPDDNGTDRWKGQEADLLLLNGTIYTVDKKVDWDKQPEQALAISSNKIAYVGNDSGALGLIGRKTRIVDLAGKMVLPGFIESHAHPSGAALLLAGVSLFNATTGEGYQKLIKEYAQDHPNASVIRGFGWNHPAFGAKGPGKELLDSIVSDRPVALFALDGHSLWVNSKALEMAEITNKTPDPAGGIIERDFLGDPSGTLRETSAASLVLTRLPPISENETKQGMMRILDLAKGLGITTIQDAGVFSEGILKSYSALENEGKLDVRIKGEQVCDPGLGPKQVPSLISERENYSSGLVQMKTAKLLLDGVVEGHTAWLLEPYADRPNFRSSPIWGLEAFNGTIAALDKAGFQIEVHAIGDGAVRMALNAYQRAQKENGKRDSRHKIAHVVVVSAADLPRFGALGVIPVPSPNWFYYDATFEQNNLAYLGHERAEHMMPMKSLIENGATVAIGTDFPACGDLPTFNPLDEIRTGVTRLPLPEDSNITKPYWPEERVDLKTMIECATIRGAYACFMENETGSLEEGKLADLIVIDRDLFRMSAEEINKAEVSTTILEGREVFGAFGENDTVSLANSLEADGLDGLSKAYYDLFKDVAREDIAQANGLLEVLARGG